MATKQIHISLQEETKEIFETLCEARFYDRSKVIESLILKWLVEEKKKGKV